MKKSKAVYVNKHKIRDDQNLVYQLYKTERGDGRRHENRTNFGSQYDSKRDNVFCTCKNTAIRKRRQDHRYFSGMPKQIFACQDSSRLVDIGVGSVKTIQRRQVKRIYLPEMDDTGVGSSDLSAYVLWRRYPKMFTVNSYYDNRRTSSKCVGGILEYNTGCVINQKLSPIIQTKSGCTSPKRSLVAKNTDIGSNTVDNQLETTGTQFEVVETVKEPVKPEKPTKPNIAIRQSNQSKQVAEKKAPTKVSEHTQKNKYSDDVVDDKTISQADKIAKEKEAVMTYSSDSLVQHVHNLENPSSEKHSRTSFPDPMENKLEREYRKMFSTTKSKDSKPSCDKPIPEFKSASILRRRFEALRRGINKKESSSKKRESVVVKTSVREIPSHKDASVTSDPPSLISRSFSDTEKYKAAIELTKREKNKNAIKKEKRSSEWQSTSVDSESPGVKGMFKLWGKKFNFEEDGYGKRQATPMASIDSKKNRKEEQTKVEATESKKEEKKFFFFKKKSKDKNKSDCIPKKDVTTGRCEIKDGIVLKIADAGKLKEKPKVPEESNEITRKAWMRKFISEAMESARSVNIRWNNSLYATSSSTVFELLDSVYKNTNVVFSQSDITGDSSYFKSFTKQVNFVQDIEAWMIPKTIPDNPVRQILIKDTPVRQIPIRHIPLHINSEKNTNIKNVGCTQSDQKWYIDKSEAFSQKIEVVLHSNNTTDICNKKVSSEYLRIDIPGDFFDTSSDEREQNHSSDEKVYKIVEYETNSEIGRARKALHKEDHVSKDIKVIVRVKDSRSLESKILETIIKRPPVHKDVVQGPDETEAQRCDVIGVGIITQRDLRELRKPILKIRDDVTDDSEPVLQLNQKKCEFAESYLQEYYRHWTPFGDEVYPWCVSDSHVGSSSEKSFASIQNRTDGSKSCPNIYEDLEPTIVTSCETSTKPCKHCTYKELINGKLYNKMMEKLKQPVKAKTESELAKKNQRIIPKDSLEVFKRRRVNDMSCRAQWAKYCSNAKDVICSVPSVQSKCCSSAKMECPKKDKPVKPKANFSNKRGSGYDQMNTNDQPCKKPIEGILSFKKSMCDSSGSGKSKCQKHAVVNPIPLCEIPQPPCKEICDLVPSPGCNKPFSPSCNTVKPNENACPEAIPICSKPRLPPEICLPPDRCVPHQPPCKLPICPSDLPACKLLPPCKRSQVVKKGNKKTPCEPPPCCEKPPPCKIPSLCSSPPRCQSPPSCMSPTPSSLTTPCPTPPPCSTLPPCMPPSPCPSPPACPSPPPPPPPPPRCPPPSCASPPPCSSPPSCSLPPPCPTPPRHTPPARGSSPPRCPSPPVCPTSPCKSFCKSGAPCNKSSILPRKPSTGSCCKKSSSLSCKCMRTCCSKCSPIPSILACRKSKSPPCKSPPCKSSPCKSPPCKTPPCKSPPCKSPPCESPPCKLPPCKSPPCKKQSSPIASILKWRKSKKTCKTCKRKHCDFTNKKVDPSCDTPSSYNCKSCCKSTSSSCVSISSCRKSPCVQSPCGSPRPPCALPKPKTPCGLPEPNSPCKPKPKPPCESPEPNLSCKPKPKPPCESPEPNLSCKPKPPCESPEPNSPCTPKPKPPCDLPKSQQPCESPKRSPCDSPNESPCDSPDETPCDSPNESPSDSPKQSPCGSPKKPSAPCMSKPGLSLNKTPSPPCPPKLPKKKLCNLPPCDTIKLSPPPKCKEERKKKPKCDEEFPWPTKNQVSNPSSPTCNSPQPAKPDCYKHCIMKKPEPECPTSKISPSPSNTSCFPDPACFPELLCSPKPSKPSCPPPKPPCPPPIPPCPPPKPSCLPPKPPCPPPKPPCPPPKLPCPPPKPPCPPPKLPCPPPKPSCPPPKPTCPSPKPPCPHETTCPPDPCAPKLLPYTPPHCTKSKIAGLFLKMKPAPKKVCDLDCGAWNEIDQKEGEFKLCSNENLSIRIKDTSSTDEIRNPMNIKVQDEDGATLYERRDYTCGNQHEAVLGDLYRESKINRVTTPLAVTNMVEDNDTKTLRSYISDKSLVNGLEINFKLCITQGDKTAEIDIEGNDGEEKLNTRTDLKKSTPEVFMVNNGRTEAVEESPKNDINIKITLRNFKTKLKHKITKDKKRTDDFSKKISDKFQTVSTGYSDVEEENVFSIHRATINLASSADVSHISSEMHVEVPNCAVSSHSINAATEDENIEEISSNTDVNNQKVKEKLTNESVLPTFNETDTEEDTNPMLMGICKCNDDSVQSKIAFKEQKKALLKKVFQKAGKRSKNKENVRELRDMLKIILTDSSEIDETNASSNTLAKDVTYTSLKPNYFKDTDSMNNYYQIESNISTMNESKINAIYPTAEANSPTSSDTEDNDMTFKGCMCSKVAERLNQANVNKIGCCCRQNYKQDEETNCDIRNAADYFLLNYQTTEYIDVETQNSRRLTSKVNSYNVSIHSSSKNKSMSNTSEDIKMVEEITVIKSPPQASSTRSQGESLSSKTGAKADDVVEQIKVIKSPASKKVSKNNSHRKYLDAEAEIQDLYQNSAVKNYGDQVSTTLTELSVKSKTNSKRSVKKEDPQATDILQSYAAKKAVLEIYAEKTENGDKFVAKLPKFVVEKESEIVKNFEEIANNSYKSVCTENVLIMSVKR